MDSIAEKNVKAMKFFRDIVSKVFEKIYAS